MNKKERCNMARTGCRFFETAAGFGYLRHAAGMNSKSIG